jgi:predicted 2-oxoglutarate/Fe(II)-dependent dioxygenase YbiX
VSRRRADGELRSVVDPSHRTATVLYAQHLAAVGRKFDEKMNAVLKPLVHHLSGQTLTDHEGTQLVRYTPGGHYIVHSDVGPLTRNRHYSVVCYLNDDFEGGGTRFPALDYGVTPERGKAILFPSGYRHGGDPVTSGEKYIIVSWVTGPIPQD